MSNQLIATVEQSGIEKSVAEMLKERFLPFFEQAQEWKEKAEGLVVTDDSQKKEMRDAREGRLALKEIRVSADKIRKSLKADSLAYGRAVQEVYNVIAEVITPIEKHLDLQERFAEIQTARRNAELLEIRKAELQPYSGFVQSSTFPILALLSREDYAIVLNGAMLQKRQHDEQVVAQGIERQRREREEAERVEREKLEREKLRLENEKLEAEKREVKRITDEQLRVEREKSEVERRRVAAEQRAIQDALNAENERLRKIEAERKEAELAERTRLAEIEYQRMIAERKAQNAPDKEKLLALAELIDAIEMPNLTGDGVKISNNVKMLLGKVTTYIRENASKI